MADNVPFAVFGPGSLYMRRTDIEGSTPMNIGYIQEFSLEESAENKELFGQKQYPLVVARGTIKVTGKAKAAMVSPIALNNAYYGEAALNAGGKRLAQGESLTPVAAVAITEALNADNLSTVTYLVTSTTGIAVNQLITGHANIPDGSYVVSLVANTSVTSQLAATGTVPSATVLTFLPGTPAVTHGADFYADLGVLSATTGQPYEKQTSPDSLVSGQYYVNETLGRYYFAAADGALTFYVTYAYDSTDGTSIMVTNKDIGNTPTFELWYATSLNAKPFVLHVFQAVSSKLGQQFKLVDFMMPEIDFGIFANAAGDVYEASYPG